MKLIFLAVFFLSIFSCMNSTVEMSTAFSTVATAILKVADQPSVSQEDSPTIQLISYFPDVLAKKLAIYNDATCSATNSKIGDLDNLLNSTIQANSLSEGTHNFFYRPIYESADLNRTAGCFSAGLTYTVDRTSPPLPSVTIKSAFFSNLPAVSFVSSDCGDSLTGASSIMFSESGTFSSSGGSWLSCASTSVFQYIVTSGSGIKTIFAYSKDLAGNVSGASAPQIFYLGAAVVSFGTGAGPSNDGLTYVTKLDATVSGNSIVFYKYKLGPSGMNCADSSNYSSEASVGIRIKDEISEFKSGVSDSSTIKLCIVGKDTNSNWQPFVEATERSWVVAPKIQNLTTDFPGTTSIIKMDNVLPGVAITTRDFIVGTDNITVSCVNCFFSVNDSALLQVSGTLNASDRIRFKVTTSTTCSTVTPSVQFVLGSIRTFDLQIRTHSLVRPASVKRIFLSRSTIDGKMSGISGADAFCNTEANLYPKFTASPYSWAAMVSVDGNEGKFRLGTEEYRDAVNSTKVFYSGNFVSSFYTFVDGTVTNGGGLTDWQYVAGAPRSTNANPIHYGGSVGGCNCGNWSTNIPNITSCFLGTVGNSVSGLLTHSTSTSFSNNSITGSLNSNYNYASCALPQHVVCFEKSN